MPLEVIVPTLSLDASILIIVLCIGLLALAGGRLLLCSTLLSSLVRVYMVSQPTHSQWQLLFSHVPDLRLRGVAFFVVTGEGVSAVVFSPAVMSFLMMGPTVARADLALP